MADEKDIAAEEGGGGGKKKLIIIIVAVVVLLLIGGAAAFFLLGGEEEGADGETADPVAVRLQSTALRAENVAANPDDPEAVYQLAAGYLD